MKKQIIIALFILLITACTIDRTPYILDMQDRYNHEDFIQDEVILTKYEYTRMYDGMNRMLNVYQEIRRSIESSTFTQKQLAQIDYQKAYTTLDKFSEVYVNTFEDLPRASQSTQNALFFSKKISKGEESDSTINPSKSVDSNINVANSVKNSMVTVQDEYKDKYKELINMSELFQKARHRMESSLFTKEQLKKFPYQKAYSATYKASKIYIVIGDFPRALESAHNALFYAKIIAKQKESTKTIQAYKRIATIYQTTQNYAKASEYTKKVISASKNIKGESTLLVSDSISKTPKKVSSSLQIDAQKAVKYEKEGNHNEALKYLKKVVDKAEESLGREHYMTANFYGKMSLNYLALNQPKKALPYATKALRIHKKIFGKYHFKTAENYLNLSVVYLQMDNIEKAYLAMKESIETILESREALFSVLSKKEKLENESYNIGHFFYIAYLYQEKYYGKRAKIAREAFDIWLRYKDEISSSESYLISLKSKTKNREAKAKINSLIETNKEYSNLFLRQISNKDAFSASNKSEIKRLKEKKNRLEGYLSSKIEEYKNSLKLKVIKSYQISQKLQKDELYIDFAHIKHNNSYFTFILNHKNQASLHQLNPKESELFKAFESIVDKVFDSLLSRDDKKEDNIYVPIDTLVKEVREDIIEKKLNKEDRHKSFNRANAKKLYRILLSKLSINDMTKSVPNAKKLIISPDGALNLLPFEVLAYGDKYLIEEKDISYVSSGKAFLKAHQQKNSSSKNRDIVVLANLDYNEKEKTSPNHEDVEGTKSLTNLIHGGRTLKPLPHTKGEAEYMETLLSRDIVLSYTQKTGTKELLNSLDSPNILHLSTHSFYGKDDKKDIDPLLKSAIALSGYNKILDENPSSEGLMTALEFSSLNLYNTELVLFSSCKSGVGDVHSSEGIFGLNKGAKLAGAKRTISTLWSVADKESVELTKDFYKHLKKRGMRDYSDALKDSKIKMIESNNKHKHPFFWAGFVQYGIN